jgi:uncharacterized protein (DUF952 family)
VADYPTLNYIPITALLERGNPWQADETLQSGDPGAIAQLASAFQYAGGCTEETWAEWVQACERFQASWNRQSGDHPIADSEEVQRATTKLFVQKDQLPLIAVDLQIIAADLAEAEKQSGAKLTQLNGQLELLDTWVAQRVADDEDWDDLLNEAKQLSGSTADEVERIRDNYTDKLEAAAFDLRKNHGYDPAGIEDVDGDGVVSPEEQGRSAPEHYNTNQRARDEALVNSQGPWAAEKADAAARLQDYATVTAPPSAAVSEEQRELAQQRLDDFRMASFVGPLPRDPILGKDARTRAQARLELQRQFEQGTLGFPPMTRDAATLAVNNGESFSRVAVTRETYQALTAAGMSSEGAIKFINEVAGGAGPTLGGLETFGANLSQPGRQPNVTDILSASDAKVLGKVAGGLGTFGDIFQLGVATEAWLNDTQSERRNEEYGGVIGNVLGGTGGGIAAVAMAGAFTNPVTAALAAGALVYLSSEVGESVGGAVGSTFDPPKS